MPPFRDGEQLVRECTFTTNAVETRRTHPPQSRCASDGSDLWTRTNEERRHLGDARVDGDVIPRELVEIAAECTCFRDAHARTHTRAPCFGGNCTQRAAGAVG